MVHITKFRLSRGDIDFLEILVLLPATKVKSKSDLNEVICHQQYVYNERSNNHNFWYKQRDVIH